MVIVLRRLYPFIQYSCQPVDLTRQCASMYPICMGGLGIEAEGHVKRLQRLVRFPSQQTDLQERDPAIKAFIEKCAEPELRQMGLEPRYDRMGNIIVEAGLQAHLGG